MFQFQPLLFVNGLGAANDPLSVVALNPALQFGWSHAGSGSGQLLIRYRVDNLSNSDSFNDLRFMVFLNPDGEQGTFLDRISEVWGPASAQQPRDATADSANPFDTITAASRTAQPAGRHAPRMAALAAATDLGLHEKPDMGQMQEMWSRFVASDDGQSCRRVR